MAGLGSTGKALLAAAVLASMVAGPADARRGGSFGSRGSRTYSAPRQTQLSPYSTGGVSRSMTRDTRGAGPAYGQQYNRPYGNAAQPGRSRGFGFGGGLLAGVVAGGLLGSLLGHGGGAGFGGSGGGGGLLVILIQLAIIGAIGWFALKLFRGRNAAPATAPAFDRMGDRGGASPFTAPAAYQPAYQPSYSAPPAADEDIGITADDQAAFERLLLDLQDAFGREDYGRLRTITTPEVMSYLAEELSDNATHGRRNEVSGTRLLDAEVSEAWREDDRDYATIAMRYEGVDVMRDRSSGAVVAGDASRPSLATELWTFVRPAGGGAWQVSAIQEA